MNALTSFGLDAASIAVVFAGLAAFLGIVAFLPSGAVQQTVKSRLTEVKHRRETMRAAMRVNEKRTKNKAKLDENTLRVMRTTIERFRMQELLENTELKMQLARAGFRGNKAPIFYLFFKIVLPFLLGLACIFYFSVLYQGPFDTTRHLGTAVVVAFVGSQLPGIWLKNLTQKRQTKMQRAFPDALDLMVICVESGMSVENAFQKVSVEIAEQSTDLAEEIALANAELSYLGDRSLAYENFARRTGMQAVKALTGALIQAERYGTPVASALRVLSEESRNERMSIAERKAAALPAKLTVPMICFFLPVLFIVIIGPAVIQVMNR